MSTIIPPTPRFELPLSRGGDLRVVFTYYALVVDGAGEPVLDAQGDPQFAVAAFPAGSSLALVIDDSPPVSASAVISGSRATVLVDHTVADGVARRALWRAVLTDAAGVDDTVCNGRTERYDGDREPPAGSGVVELAVCSTVAISGCLPSVRLEVSQKGDDGQDGAPGAPGPANSLTIGTVDTGTAAASITGTAPSQVLNLTLPAPSGGGGSGRVLHRDSSTGWPARPDDAITTVFVGGVSPVQAPADAKLGDAWLPAKVLEVTPPMLLTKGFEGIVRRDADGTETMVAAGLTAYGVGADDSGRYYVASIDISGTVPENNKVVRVETDGTQTVLKAGVQAYAVAVNAATGETWFSDGGTAGTLWHVDAAGTATELTAGAGMLTVFCNPTTGQLYGCSVAGDLVSLAADGTPTTLAAGIVAYNTGFDPVSGDLFLLDVNTSAAKRVTAAGVVTNVATGVAVILVDYDPVRQCLWGTGEAPSGLTRIDLDGTTTVTGTTLYSGGFHVLSEEV